MIAPEQDFTDPIRILLDCHRCIEASLATLTGLNKSAHREPLNAEDREAIQVALTCFRDMAPLHTADEEETLFPHIRTQQDSRVLPVLARIESLEEEHVCSDRIYPELDALCRIWLTRGTLCPDEAARLSVLVGSLRNLYRHHIAVEESEIFPIAAVAFPEATMRAVGREMALRRNSSRGKRQPESGSSPE